MLAHADRDLADSLMRQLARESDAWEGKLIRRLSLSAGYALAQDHEGISAEKLVIFADEGMYAQKHLYYQRPENNRRTFSNANS